MIVDPWAANSRREVYSPFCSDSINRHYFMVREDTAIVEQLSL